MHLGMTQHEVSMETQSFLNGVLSTFQKQRSGFAQIYRGNPAALSFFVHRRFKRPRDWMKNVFQTLYDVTNCARKTGLLKSVLLLSARKPGQKSKQLLRGRLCRNVRAQREFPTFNWRKEDKKSNLVAGIMLEACARRAEGGKKKNPVILFLHYG